ncbi:hypothetical protein G7076_06145 [Sphingomonas sp. HDW15A]|uniref:hypothetical protein n=1 Tax=Sphingomonas sp. HDW15A TaxID=2714942 RepID=UPI00140E5787|nr:hypothetical protein [Sphingomonas sp. HDW15A]QIK96085.1 hypothetical protein G7076_06145 [Sphingomonas sp. HDW15A]
MQTFAAWALGIAMIAAFLLIVGGIVLIRRDHDGKRGVLMLIAAAVLIANVAIWTV